VDEAEAYYVAAGEHLSLVAHFGSDPLADSPELIQQCHRAMQQNIPTPEELFAFTVNGEVEHPQWWKTGKVCAAQPHDKLEHGREHTGRRMGQDHLPHYKMEYGQKHPVWGSIKRCHALHHWGSPCLGNTIPCGLQNKPQFYIRKQSQLGIL